MMEREKVLDQIVKTRHNPFGCSRRRREKRNKVNSTDEEEGTVGDYNWNGNSSESDSSYVYFENELDQLLDQEEHDNRWNEHSEIVDTNRTEDDSLPKVTVFSQTNERVSPLSSFIDSEFEDELDRLLNQEEDDDSRTKPSETVDMKESSSNMTDVSQTRVRGFSFHPTEVSRSSEEDEDAYSYVKDAIKTVSKAAVKKGRKKDSPQSSPTLASTPAKCRRNADPALPLTNGSERRWRTEDEPDLQPKLFPFKPARNPGPQLDAQKNYTPLEVFQLFFSKDVVDTLCLNTNKNAQRRQKQQLKEPWRTISVEEMYKYLSIIIYMGLLNVHNVSDYWVANRLYGIPFCRSVMTMSRFRAITYSLHMSDPAEDEENDKRKGTAGYDQLMRIKPLKDQILEACRTLYHPFQNLSIDELMVRSKSRNSLKQSFESKHERYGFKVYVLADSRNGYTWDFNVFVGKNPSASGKGDSYDAVMNLLNIPRLGTGYHIYLNKDFTSATLLRDLYRKHLGACGTIREQYMGLSCVQENSMAPTTKRGTINWLRDGELLFTKWMDARPVTMCSTIHKAFAEDQVQRRKQLEDGTWLTQSLPAPEQVKPYNQYVGGVDLGGSLIKCYSVAQKTMKWYKTFFFHFVDVAVVNSWLMHKDLAVTSSKKPMVQKQFREKLCSQLAGIALSGSVQERGHDKELSKQQVEQQYEQLMEQQYEQQGKQWVEQHYKFEQQGKQQSEIKTDQQFEEEREEEELEVGSMCCPVPTHDPTIVESWKKASEGRKNCRFCKQKTVWQCESCRVALCIIPERNCFRLWHINKDKKEHNSGE